MLGSLIFQHTECNVVYGVNSLIHRPQNTQFIPQRFQMTRIANVKFSRTGLQNGWIGGKEEGLGAWGYSLLIQYLHLLLDYEQCQFSVLPNRGERLSASQL